MRDHNYAAQYADTKAAFKRLLRQQLHTDIRLELRFAPMDADADWGGLAASLQNSGYDVEIETDDATIRTQTTQLTPELRTLWVHEQRMTEIAVMNDFKPSGWRLIKAPAQDGLRNDWSIGPVLQGWRAQPH